MVTTNTTLTDLPLETEHPSDSHDLVHDFYLPCLERSTLGRNPILPTRFSLWRCELAHLRLVSSA